MYCDEGDQNAVTGGYYRRRCSRIVLVELWGGANVKRTISLAVALLSGLLAVNLAHAQSAGSGVEKLYILNCGEGVAGDISRWSPGLNEGKSMNFVDSCYLIKHAQGWFLWDTGVADSIAAMPDGLAPRRDVSSHPALRAERRIRLARYQQRAAIQGRASRDQARR